MYLVAIYEKWLGYGGPEEGGWYYQRGELVKVVAAKHSKEAAYAAAARCNGWLERLQKGKREVSSAIYAGGRHCARVYRDIAPARYPECTPHYE